MKQYRIVKIHEPISWDQAETAYVNEVLWLPDAGIRMEQKICYDDTALYIRQLAFEKDIRSVEDGILSPVCQDSCMEFFFRPEGDLRYLNFELNPNGTLNLGLGTERKGRIRLVQADYKEVFHIKTVRNEESWEASYQIPLSFLQLIYPGILLSPGLVFEANYYKCGDKTSQKHYLSWNRVCSEKPDFHRPQDFGKLLFT